METALPNVGLLRHDERRLLERFREATPTTDAKRCVMNIMMDANFVPDATGKPFVDKLWSAQIPTGTYRYYDGTLDMLGLLHVSGTFKLWF